MRLNELVEWLNERLLVNSFQDSALNGLQVEAGVEVEQVAVSVDACLESVDQAIAGKADLLLSHHGLFWGKVRPITGSLARMLEKMFAARLSLYASHLPLDAHPELGNNARLARLLGLEEIEPFGKYRDQAIGFVGVLPGERPRGDVLDRLGEELEGLVGSALYGPEQVRRVAVVSGGAGSVVADALESKVDLMITGEMEHIAAVFARDNELNLAFFGHWATETLGVKALASEIEEQFGLPWTFVGRNTGC